MEKRFCEIVSIIKQGQIWETEHSKIYLYSEGSLVISPKDYSINDDVNIRRTDKIFIKMNTFYRLKE